MVVIVMVEEMGEKEVEEEERREVEEVEEKEGRRNLDLICQFIV